MSKVNNLTEAQLKTIENVENSVKNRIDWSLGVTPKSINYQESANKPPSVRKLMVNKALKRADSLNSSPIASKNHRISLDVQTASLSPIKSNSHQLNSYVVDSPFCIKRFLDSDQEYEEMYKNYTQIEKEREKHLELLTQQLNEVKEKYESLVKKGEIERRSYESSLQTDELYIDRPDVIQSLLDEIEQKLIKNA